MKIPCFVDAHPSDWFGNQPSRDTLDLLLSQLKGVLLHTRASYFADLQELRRAQTRLAPLYEKLISEFLIFTTEEPGIDYYVFKNTQNAEGALLCGWGSQEMKLKEIEYQSAKAPQSNDPVPLDESIRFHTKRAQDLTLIDPYFGTQLCKSPSPEQSLHNFFSADVREVRIYTGIPKADYWEMKDWGEWLGPKGEILNSLSKEALDTIARDRSLFREQFNWRLQRQLERLSHLSHSQRILISVHSSSNFPHDRHLAFSFPSVDTTGNLVRSASVKDYFSLGNGLTTLGYLGRRKSASHVYHSDTARMWAGFGQSEREASQIVEFIKEPESRNWQVIIMGS